MTERTVDQVKRWAFVPLLVIVLAVIGGSVARSGGHSLTLGNVIGVVVAVPVALYVDRRRRQHRTR